MPEIDKLTAQVEVDNTRANRQLDQTDRKADQVAEDRLGVVKLIVDDGDLKDFETRSKRRGGILGSILGGGDGDAIPVLEVHQLTDAVGEAVGGLKDMAKEGGEAAQALLDVGDAGDKGGGGMLRLVSGVSSSSGGFIALVGSGQGAIAMIALLIGKVAILGPLLVTLGGGVAGLVAAFAPLVGLLGVLPGLLLGLGGALVVLTGAFSGVGEAVAEQQEATKDIPEKARMMSSAILGLASAVLAEERAQRQASTARRDAAEAIEDAQFAATAAQIGEERAILALERAYARLAAVQSDTVEKTEEITKVTDFFTGKQFEVARITFDAVKSQDDLADAKLGVRDAELGLLMAQDRREDTEIALRDLEIRGIENSDILIDSQLALAQAELGVANAQALVAESLAALTGEGSAYNELTESGKGLVDMIGELLPLWEEFKDTMAEIILPEATEALENLKPILEELDTILSPVAEAIGTIFTDLSEELGSDTFIGKLTEFFDNYGEDLATLGPTFGSIAQGIADIALAAEPLQSFLFDKFNEFFGEGGKFREWAAGDSEMGDLTDWFQLTADVLDKTLDIIGNLIVGFTGFVEAATPAGQEMLDNMVALSEEFSVFTNSAEGQNSIAEFFDRIMEPLGALSSLAGTVLKTMVDVFGSEEALGFLTDVATTLEDDVIPAIGAFFNSLFESGLLNELAEGIGELFATLSELERIGALDALFTGMRVIAAIADMVFKIMNGLLRLIPDDLLNIGLSGDEVGDFYDILFGRIDEEIIGFFETLPMRITEAMAGGFAGMWDGIWEELEGAINVLIDKWNGFADEVPFGIIPHIDRIGGRESTNGVSVDDEFNGLSGGDALIRDAILGAAGGNGGTPWWMQALQTPITQVTQNQFDIDVNGSLDAAEFVAWQEWQLSSKADAPPPPPPASPTPRTNPNQVIPGFRGPQ